LSYIVVLCIGKLVPCKVEHGRTTCTSCGLIDPNHEIYEFMGSYCEYHKSIHYRWINKDWSQQNTKLFRKRRIEDPIISPIPTENSLERFYLRGYFWVINLSTCSSPDFNEVMWTGYEESESILLRSMDTGYRLINQHGVHAPILASIFEWFLHRYIWVELRELVAISNLTQQLKNSIINAIDNPTPTNVFKFLWSFHNYIPGWHSSRSLGRRSPSLLLQDEIRWTTNRITDLDESELKRLKKCGPEEDLWGSWKEMWPTEVELTGNLTEFGSELIRIGIKYTNQMDIVFDNGLVKNSRTWDEVAIKLIEWPLEFDIGGILNHSNSIRSNNGFISNLQKKISISVPKIIESKNNNWEDYLKVRMPLSWELIETNENIITFTLSSEQVNENMLNNTLRSLEPWIKNQANHDVLLIIIGDISNNHRTLLNSMTKRLIGTLVKIELN